MRPTLESVDLRFSNCERQYSERGANARAEGDGMDWASEGFEHTFTRRGDEVMVTA